MRRIFLALTATLCLVPTIVGASTPASADTHPRVPNRPNGMTAARAAAAVQQSFGDCAVSGVTCKPNLAGSCTGFSSQNTPPATIRVYVPSDTTDANHIATVPFETYVENVLPNEWAASWDGDALKAGAVAVTSYAWYWTTHYGGYVGTASPTTCFDVTDDQNFQVYAANSAVPNSTAKVQQVFPTAIRVGGAVLQASYFSAVNPNYSFGDPSTYDACGQGADGTFLSQSGSQTCNQDNTANKWPVILKLYYGQYIQLATTAQLRTQHDFQYLHRSTPATYNSGTWTIADGYPTTIHFGLAGDIPVVNTIGDGFARTGVYRPSNQNWYFCSANGAQQTAQFSFGLSGDIPVAAQYHGLSAPTQAAVFRPWNGTWYLAGPNGGTVSTVQWGLNGDVPVPGRWLSNTTDSLTVWRPSSGNWYVRGGGIVQWGLRGDIPVPADYNGDGMTDIAVYRPSTLQFFIRGQAPIQWGLKGDIPVTGDFDGDGRSDLAVYRPSNRTLYIRGIGTVSLPAGIPVGAAPYSD